jgi:hypothetical protein
VSVYSIIAIAAVIGIGIAVAAFRWPNRVFLRSAIAVMCALALPYVVVYTIRPFLGEGAGMGVAFILYALSAAILLVAISASIGAAARHMWTALHKNR